MVAASNGHLTGKSFAGTDTGRWSVRSGKLCIMLRDWFDGQTRCSHVVRGGNRSRAETVRFRKILSGSRLIRSGVSFTIDFSPTDAYSIRWFVPTFPR